MSPIFKENSKHMQEVWKRGGPKKYEYNIRLDERTKTNGFRNQIDSVVALVVVLGGLGYLGYKQYKKRKRETQEAA